MNEHNLKANIEALREYSRHEGWSIVTEREIPYGYQLIVTDGVTKVPISFFSTGKMLIQGGAGILKTELQKWEQERNSISIKSAPLEVIDVTSTTIGTSRTSQFYISQDHIKKVKPVLLQLKAQIVEQDPSSDSHQLFRLRVHRDNERVMATQYSNGTLQIQGRTSKLFDDVQELVENSLQSFAERGARYIPDNERILIHEHMSLPHTKQKALDWVYKHLDKPVYEFLHNTDRQTYLSGAGLFLSVEETGLALPDYSIIVMPFARSYEGFIIQLAVHLNIIDYASSQGGIEPMKVGEYINNIKEKIEKTDKGRYGGLADTQLSVWKDVRHKVMHSDPLNPPPHKRLEDAIQDIEAINRAIRRSYEYFVEREIIKPTALKEQSIRSKKNLNNNEVDVKKTQTQPRQDSYKVTSSQPKSDSATTPNISNTKITVTARIGLDESGKGDYFGPLVIGAVYVDEQTEARLIAVGVRDSKLLPDNRILAIAEEIQVICPYSVVIIRPKRYNELYKEIQNLNRLLAWGHARSLENVLKTVTCSLAVADQFGDESLILKALMEKGRQIKLEQRPRAETDTSVAAASILARAGFVQRMELLSKQIGKNLPKGASDPSIITVGREIVAKGGRDALSEVAKMHFKTTEKILQSV